MKKEADICLVTSAVLRKCQSDLAALQQAETRLRASLADLRASRHAPQSDGGDLSRHTTGIELSWQRWIDRQERQLMIELAQLRARREPLLRRLRKEFGRDQAAQQLLAMARAASVKGRLP